MQTSNSAESSLLGLDVGERRIGVAIASLKARLPRPLTTLDNNQTIFDAVAQLVLDNGVAGIVVGLPRGLDGQETSQTKFARDFAQQLKRRIDVKIYLVDEAVTSVNAETELRARGKDYSKADIDALAANYILQDYLDNERS